MIWIALALLAPLLYAGSNFVDKYALESHFEKLSIKSYVAATGIVGIPFLAFVAGFASDEVTSISLDRAAQAFAGGLCISLGIAVYLRALSRADASLVASLFHLIIILNYVFGRLFLNESLSSGNLILIGAFIVGAVLLTVEQGEDGIKFKKDVFGLMLASCALISLSDLLFKVSAIDGGNYAASQFFEYAATVTLGLLILLFSRKTSNEFKTLAATNASKVVKLLLFNEVLNLIGTIFMRLSSLHIPLAVLQAIMGIQSIYLIVLGFILTKIWPHRIQENIGRRHLFGKLVAIAIMIVAEIGLIMATV